MSVWMWVSTVRQVRGVLSSSRLNGSEVSLFLGLDPNLALQPAADSEVWSEILIDSSGHSERLGRHHTACISGFSLTAEARMCVFVCESSPEDLTPWLPCVRMETAPIAFIGFLFVFWDKEDPSHPAPHHHTPLQWSIWNSKHSAYSTYQRL